MLKYFSLHFGKINLVESKNLFSIVSAMKHFAISLFMALTLLIAPVVHAAGLCTNDNEIKIEVSSVHKAFSQDSKQGDKKAQQSLHCLCAHSVCDRITEKAPEPVFKATQVIITSEANKMTSLSYGPPLEPPSRA